MHYRSIWLAAAVLTTLGAGRLAAQTFEQTVNGTLSKDSPIYSQTGDLKQSVQKNAALTRQALDQQAADEAQAKADAAAEQAYQDKQSQVDEDADGVHPPGGGGGGGGHPSPPPSHPPGGGNPGGGHPNPPGGGHPNPPGGGHPNPPGGGHPNPPPGGGHHPPPPGGGHPGGHNPPPTHPGHGHPPTHEPGHHEHAPNRDWGRWEGHPGWGHHHDRWYWDRYGYPYWWGWVIWRGERRSECVAHYDGLLGQCNDACQDEHDQCRKDCDAVGGGSECEDQCNANTNSCFDSCLVSYDDQVAQYCPAGIRSTKVSVH